MKLEKIIDAQLDSLGLGKFKILTADIKIKLEPVVERTVRKKVVAALDAVCDEARKTAKKQQKEINHEITKE